MRKMRKQVKWAKAARTASLRDNPAEISVPGWSRENNRRAAEARRALTFYLWSKRDPATAVRTLLSDLRHYCDARGVDFKEENAVAERDYVGQVLDLI